MARGRPLTWARDGQSGGAPFGIAVLKAPRFEAAAAEQGARFEREDAVRASVVGHYPAVPRYLAQAARELPQRNVDGCTPHLCDSRI